MRKHITPKAVAAQISHDVQALIRSTRGTALIETVVIAPVLAVVIMGTVDVSRFGAARLQAQQAVNRGLEMATMGGPTTATTNVQSEVAAQANVSTANVTVTQSQTCGGTTATYGSTCSSVETRKFFTVSVSSSFQPTFVGGAVARILGVSNGNVAITTAGTVRVA